MEVERVWKGSCAVESVHVMTRDDGKQELVIVTAGGPGGLAEWILKATAALHGAERRRMEDPDGD